LIRLGAVSFLNARPLIEGLEGREDVELFYDVPARLPALLDAGRVDAALTPLIDVIRSAGRYRVVSDACIGCDGETMTVRIFSQVSPDRIRTLHVDGDSHTSVALARVLWRELHGRELELRPLDRSQDVGQLESVLLIGDKVVQRRRGFAYEVDLGGAWRQHTGLPFVFAVWATRNREWRIANGEWEGANGDERAEREVGVEGVVARSADSGCLRGGAAAGSPGTSPEPSYEFGIRNSLFAILSAARDRGVARAAQIAEQEGPKRWWPVDVAKRYLTECLKFTIDARYVQGADYFAELCARIGAAPPDAGIAWPEALRSRPGRMAGSRA